VLSLETEEQQNEQRLVGCFCPNEKPKEEAKRCFGSSENKLTKSIASIDIVAFLSLKTQKNE